MCFPADLDCSCQRRDLGPLDRTKSSNCSIFRSPTVIDLIKAVMAGASYPPISTRVTFSSRHHKAPFKIALEEHMSTKIFNPTQTLPPQGRTAELPYANREFVDDIEDRLTNIDARIEGMDRAGVALAIISLTMPGIEGIFEPTVAVEMARKVNDEIHQLYTAGPHAKRFRAFGVVPMQDPAAATVELERCVRELGFVGVLVNGYSNMGGANTVQYLDEPACEIFWAKLEELDIPLYLHPRIPPPDQLRLYQGYEFLAGSPWGFGVETAGHAIRLMASGLFDRHPRLKIILGHCGEGLPFSLHRIDHRMRHFQEGLVKCKLRMQDYWERNFWVTTSGVMSDGAFTQTVKLCGEDRVLWSADYPYEDYDEMARWFDGLEISENTRASVGWKNAERLFGLKVSEE